MHFELWQTSAKYNARTVVVMYSLGASELEIFIRIESRIESTAAIRIGIESGCSRLRVQYRLPRELCKPTAYYRELQCSLVCMILLHKHKIINIR